MFKFSSKQKLAIKSWFHAAIATETFALVNYLTTAHSSGMSFVKGAGYALLAPITRSLFPAVSKRYTGLAKKYPKLVPFAKRLIAREAKKVIAP